MEEVETQSPAPEQASPQQSQENAEPRVMFSIDEYTPPATISDAERFLERKHHYISTPMPPWFVVWLPLLIVVCCIFLCVVIGVISSLR